MYLGNDSPIGSIPVKMRMQGKASKSRYVRGVQSGSWIFSQTYTHVAHA